jgi:hypothetical protein
VTSRSTTVTVLVNIREPRARGRRGSGGGDLNTRARAQFLIRRGPSAAQSPSTTRPCCRRPTWRSTPPRTRRCPSPTLR